MVKISGVRESEISELHIDYVLSRKMVFLFSGCSHYGTDAAFQELIKKIISLCEVVKHWPHHAEGVDALYKFTPTLTVTRSYSFSCSNKTRAQQMYNILDISNESNEPETQPCVQTILERWAMLGRDKLDT